MSKVDQDSNQEMARVNDSQPKHFICDSKIVFKLNYDRLPAVRLQLDSLQFAYRAKRGTKDAVAWLLHSLLKHLESQSNFTSVLFVALPSVQFNTIKWLRKFTTSLHSSSPGFTTSSVKDHRLSKQAQYHHQLSSPTPSLSTLYTFDSTSHSSINTFFKYSDDTAILSLLNNAITLLQP